MSSRKRSGKRRPEPLALSPLMRSQSANWWKPRKGEPYRPLIALPSQIKYDIDPWWANCTDYDFKAFDPPRTLEPAKAMAPKVTADDPKPSPVDAKPSPAQDVPAKETGANDDLAPSPADTPVAAQPQRTGDAGDKTPPQKQTEPEKSSDEDDPKGQDEDSNQQADDPKKPGAGFDPGNDGSGSDPGSGGSGVDSGSNTSQDSLYQQADNPQNPGSSSNAGSNGNDSDPENGSSGFGSGSNTIQDNPKEQADDPQRPGSSSDPSDNGNGSSPDSDSNGSGPSSDTPQDYPKQAAPKDKAQGPSKQANPENKADQPPKSSNQPTQGQSQDKPKDPTTPKNSPNDSAIDPSYNPSDVSPDQMSQINDALSTSSDPAPDDDKEVNATSDSQTSKDPADNIGKNPQGTDASPQDPITKSPSNLQADPEDQDPTSNTLSGSRKGEPPAQPPDETEETPAKVSLDGSNNLIFYGSTTRAIPSFTASLGEAPTAIVNGQPVHLLSNGAISMAGTTLQPGAAPITLSNIPSRPPKAEISLDSSGNLILDGSITRALPSFTKAQQEGPVATINGQIIKSLSDGAVSIAGTTIHRGGDAAIITVPRSTSSTTATAGSGSEDVGDLIMNGIGASSDSSSTTTNSGSGGATDSLPPPPPLSSLESFTGGSGTLLHCFSQKLAVGGVCMVLLLGMLML